MNLSYKNHKKHKMYPSGRSEKEKIKEFNVSLNPTSLSRFLKRVWELIKSKFPF